jgi:large subunit ribosomal protein L23
MDVNQIIIAPVLTEKSNVMRDGEIKKYIFKVHPRANKLMIKQAVAKIYGVKAVQCNMLNVKGKPKSTRTKSGFRYGSTTPWKKAIVTLATGEKIDAFEGVS